MELKKILIEKMEGNKSIQRSDKQQNLYKALVKAYEADKVKNKREKDKIETKPDKNRKRDEAEKSQEQS
nr:hypothetical protein [Tanacetum cinerariifolium]